MQLLTACAHARDAVPIVQPEILRATAAAANFIDWWLIS